MPDSLQLVVGLMLWTVAAVAMVRLRSETRGWSFARRARVAVVPLIGLTAFYVLMVWRTMDPTSSWWRIPGGLAAAVLLEVGIARLMTRRERLAH